MNNIRKYLGIPFADQGREFSGADCLGVILLFYKHELGINLPDNVNGYDSAYLADSVQEYVEAYQVHGEISHDVSGEPRLPFDVYVFKIGGIERHVGLHLPDGNMLHLMHGQHSCIEDPQAPKWKDRISKVLRYVENNKP